MADLKQIEQHLIGGDADEVSRLLHARRAGAAPGGGPQYDVAGDVGSTTLAAALVRLADDLRQVPRARARRRAGTPRAPEARLPSRRYPASARAAATPRGGYPGRA
jgi:hypothetical protein